MKIIMKLTILLLLFSNTLLFGEGVKTFIDYDFNKAVKDGLIISQATGVKGVHRKLNPGLLENLPGKPENRALRIKRRKLLEFVHIQSKESIPENCNYKVSLRCNLKEKGNFVIGFWDAEGKRIAALYFRDNKLRGYDTKKKWKFTGIRIPKNEWFNLK